MALSSLQETMDDNVITTSSPHPTIKMNQSSSQTSQHQFHSSSRSDSHNQPFSLSSPPRSITYHSNSFGIQSMSSDASTPPPPPPPRNNNFPQHQDQQVPNGVLPFPISVSNTQLLPCDTDETNGKSLGDSFITVQDGGNTGNGQERFSENVVTTPDSIAAPISAPYLVNTLTDGINMVYGKSTNGSCVSTEQIAPDLNSPFFDKLAPIGNVHPFQPDNHTENPTFGVSTDGCDGCDGVPVMESKIQPIQDQFSRNESNLKNNRVVETSDSFILQINNDRQIGGLEEQDYSLGSSLP
jgi:hypothetical protein